MQLQIEKLVYGGDGLARLPAEDGQRRLTAFVPFTLPGEVVTAQLGPVERRFARAELISVVDASPDRAAPPCPYFTRCGGCQLQHAQYAAQLAQKQNVLCETFERSGIAFPGPVRAICAGPLGYRSRVRLQVRSGNTWQVGYRVRRSHSLLPIEQCPIASPLIHRTIDALRKNEITKHAPSVQEIELFASPDDAAVLLSAHSDSNDERFKPWMAALQAEIQELRGGVLFAEKRKPQPPAISDSYGETWLDCRVNNETYRVSAGAFFQGNRYLLGPLVQAVCDAVQPAPAAAVWDLYAGVGLFSLPLARAGAAVTAVEGAPASARDIQHNLRGTSARAIHASVESFLTSAAARTPPLCILLDPPRTGLDRKTLPALARIRVPRIVYLSCDPVTLARDLKALLTSGYRIENATLFDLFPQTFHMETLVTLTRC